MKLSIDILRRFVPLPDDPGAVRDLLDDVGVEVKRADGDQLTVELLANRGDHYCYDGVAREIAARTGAALSAPDVAHLQTGDSWPVVLETDLCLVYTATVLERDAEATGRAFPSDVLAPLAAAGIHSLTAPVDATNLSNLELGQPTHVFDADKIDGEIVVRLSRAGERAWPLFQDAPVEVPEGTLVIADRSKILAIAGVIGCEDSKTTASTTRIVLESACFDPVKVRIASRALGIHTDSTARFERGSDPARPLLGAGRVVHLLEAFTGWARAGATTVVGAWTDPNRVIALDPDATATFLGLEELDADRISGLLARQGFARAGTDASGRVAFRVPSWRLWDVEYRADLYEELAKAVGYNDTPVTLPMVDRGALPSPAEVRKRAAEEVLLGHGFYEVFTDGFYGRAVPELLGVDDGHPLAAHLETLNALDRDSSLLKNNALGQAILAVDQNLRVKTDDVRLYEWTRTFHPVEALVRDSERDRHDPPCTERALLWAIVSGRDRERAWDDRSRDADVHFLAGILAELGVALGLDLRLGPPDPDAALYGALHPGRQATVLQGDLVIGILGEVHPQVLKRARIKRARPCYLELDADALASDGDKPPYRDPASLQPLERSLAFDLPPRFPAARIVETLRTAGPTTLESIAITDRFDHEEDGTPLRAITFALTFDNRAGGLSADAVNATLIALQQAVVAAHGAAGVATR